MLNIIVAIDQKDAIGGNNKLLWHSSKDMKHFKETTMGHTIVMGRKTHESIGRALPGRTNVVLSRDPSYKPLDSEVVPMDDINFVFADRFVSNIHTFVIGGATLYKLFIPYAERLYLTRIPGTFEADTYLPTVDWHNWKKVSTRSEYESGLGILDFEVWERVNDIEHFSAMV